ncbi:MAG: TolC family protein [Planctomycetota bacterium]
MTRSASASFGGLMLGLALVIGCQSDDSMSRLDLEAQRIIHQQQARSLGPNAAATDTFVPTPEAAPDDSLYAYDPATANTPADRLVIEAAPIVDQVPYPTILDDGTKPDTLRLDLEAIIAQAIEFAPDYRREKEELFLTTLSLIVERHEWGPRFFSTVTGQVEGTPEAGDNDTALNLIGSLGVTQRLPYGGTVSATALVDYVRFLEQASTNTGDDETQAADLQFSLDLPLLRGAGKTAATVETRIQAERDLIYAVRGFERFRREFFVDLATTYFDLVRRQRQLANQELQLRNFESSSELFVALAEAGREPYFQAERAEQRVLRARNSLINQQENYVRAIDALKLRIGIDTTRSVEIIPVEIIVPEVLLETDTSVATALDQRLDLQTVGDFVEDAVRDVLIAKNQLLPDLDLTADLTLPTDETVARGGLDFEASDGEYEVGLTLGLPLDRKIEYTDYRASLIRLEREKRDYQVERDRIALEVRRAVRAIEQARFILQLQERAVQINERRASQIDINARSLGPREVIDVQEDLLDARNDRDEAKSDLRINILEYLLATGQMRVGPDGRWLAPGRLIDPAETPTDGVVEPTS